MEKTVVRKNMFTYIADFFRSIGESAKVIMENEKEEVAEGLDAISIESLSAEDQKTLEDLKASRAKIRAFAAKHEKEIRAIDMPKQGKEFKEGVRSDEEVNPIQEQVVGEKERDDELSL